MNRKPLGLILVGVLGLAVVLSATTSQAVNIKLASVTPSNSVVQVLGNSSNFQGMPDEINNEILVKTFSGVGAAAFDPIVAHVNPQVSKDALDGTTKYLHWTERVVNYTDQTWTGFTVSITGATFAPNGSNTLNWAPQVVSINGGGLIYPTWLDEDEDPINQISSGALATVSNNNTKLFYNISVAPGGAADLYLPIAFTGTGNFTVTQAAVPEPTTLAALAGLGLVGLVFAWRRRK